MSEHTWRADRDAGLSRGQENNLDFVETMRTAAKEHSILHGIVSADKANQARKINVWAWEG